jgi:hypothetical protein
MNFKGVMLPAIFFALTQAQTAQLPEITSVNYSSLKS